LILSFRRVLYVICFFVFSWRLSTDSRRFGTDRGLRIVGYQYSEAGKTPKRKHITYGDIFSCRTQLFVFEEDVKEYNGSSRNTYGRVTNTHTHTHTHTICNLGVCVFVCVSVCLLQQLLEAVPAVHSNYT
jgi:hypothetical protein